MIYDFREYDDNEIPRFMWEDHDDRIECFVKIKNSEVKIVGKQNKQLIENKTNWTIKATKIKGSVFMNTRLEDVTKEEMMVIVETYILDQLT
jgi:hypothetical protein